MVVAVASDCQWKQRGGRALRGAVACGRGGGQRRGWPMQQGDLSLACILFQAWPVPCPLAVQVVLLRPVSQVTGQDDKMAVAAHLCSKRPKVTILGLAARADALQDAANVVHGRLSRFILNLLKWTAVILDHSNAVALYLHALFVQPDRVVHGVCCVTEQHN